MEKLYHAAASVDWEKESFPEYQDLIFLICFALFFPVLRFTLNRLFFEVNKNLELFLVAQFVG